MNDTTHELLNKLRVIGKVTEGESLDTTNGLQVYTPSWFAWVCRKLNFDNKNEVTRAVRDLYKSIQQSVKTIIGEMRATSNTEKKTRLVYVIVNIATEIKNSIKGLDNMSKTYRSWPTTVSELEGIIKDYVMVTYNTLLDAIPADKKPAILDESIIYTGQTIYKGIDDISINDESVGNNDESIKSNDTDVTAALSNNDELTD